MSAQPGCTMPIDEQWHYVGSKPNGLGRVRAQVRTVRAAVAFCSGRSPPGGVGGLAGNLGVARSVACGALVHIDIREH